MKFVIDDNGLRHAAPQAVYDFLNGAHSVDTIKQWNDAQRASFNVFRRVDKREQGDTFQSPGNSTLVRVGDVVEWRASAADVALGVAQDRMRSLLQDQFIRVTNGGVDIGGFPVFTDIDHLTEYNSYQNALDAGEPYPGGGIPVILMDGTKFRANATQWALLLRGVAVHRINCNLRWDNIDNSINSAGSVADIRTVHSSYQTGWPANPTL